jgi:hypothetical protein
MPKKMISVFVGENRIAAVLLRDVEEELVCPWCDEEIKIGKNKWGLFMAVEWTRTFGFRPHQCFCEEFKIDQFLCPTKVSAVKYEGKLLEKSEPQNKHEQTSFGNTVQNFITGKAIC